MHEKPRFPRTLANLRRWLSDTEIGREIVRETTVGFLENECRKCQRIRPYPKVLAVVRRLGFKPGVEVFYERGVNVKCIELVDSEGDPAIEILVEKILELQLPRAWKPLVGCRSDSQVFTGLTAERRIETIETLQILKELKAL